MDDASTPAPEQIQDTPAAAPEVEDTQPTPVDYRARYENLRPEFDRKSQQLAEYEERLAAYEAQQQEPEEEDGEEYDWEDTVARRELAELRAALAAEREQANQEKAYVADSEYITSEIETLEKELDDSLDERESNLIGNYAYHNRDENGKPDVRAAYQLYTDGLEARKAKWVKTKRSPKVNSGPAAVDVPDLDNPKQRVEYIDRRMAEADDSF